MEREMDAMGKEPGKGPKPAAYPLDNAAVMFSLVGSASYPAVYQLSLALDEEIDPGRLQNALDRIIGRFPYFRVRFARTPFWHYLASNPAPLPVQPAEGYPCRRFLATVDRGYLLRILYRGRRLMVEMSHALTDGTGGLIFLASLAAEYLRLGGIWIPVQEGILPGGRTAFRGI